MDRAREARPSHAANATAAAIARMMTMTIPMSGLKSKNRSRPWDTTSANQMAYSAKRRAPRSAPTRRIAATKYRVS